jgi:Bacterial EndoU nuclease
VAIDGPSGAYDDDPERGGGPKPEKGHEHGRPDASHPADRQPAEVRSRAEYYEALRAIDIRVAAAGGVESAASTARTRSAWDSEAVGDHPDPPPLDSLRVAPERAGHILDGDRWGGGHRHGTGRPEKTEFPCGWDDDKIIGHILDVARAPDDPPVFQANRRWRVHGQRDDVGITVIVQPDGSIWSAWPDAGSPGVVKNPRETQ